MPTPDMRAYVQGLIGVTIETVAEGKPNKILAVTGNRVLIETETGHRNYASLTELQELADGVYAGNEVVVEPHGRSAFHLAVLARLPEVEFAIRPRRVWLRAAAATFDAEYADLFPEEDPQVAQEGRALYRRHRFRERDSNLPLARKRQALEETGELACEACEFQYAEMYGSLGDGFIECHHTEALAELGERETTLEELALVCANCHRMIHRSIPMLSVEDLRHALKA